MGSICLAKLSLHAYKCYAYIKPGGKVVRLTEGWVDHSVRQL